MSGDKNRLRQQVVDEVGAGLTWALQHDRKALAILVLQIVNAAWFALLWAHGFRPWASVMVWALFFVASLVAMIAIERRRARELPQEKT